MLSFAFSACHLQGSSCSYLTVIPLNLDSLWFSLTIFCASIHLQHTLDDCIDEIMAYHKDLEVCPG